MYTAEKDLALTRAGKVVEQSDPDAHSVLVNAGSQLPDAIAQKHGLVDVDGNVLDIEHKQKTEKSLKGPSEDKALKSAPNK